MIGGENQRGVAPQVVAVEVVEQLPEIVIARRDQRRIVGANLGDLLGRAAARFFVERPVEDAAPPARRILLLEARGRLERLVRVEAFEHQEPRIGGAVDVEKLECGGEATRERQVFLLGHELAVDRVLDALPATVVAIPGAPPARIEVVVLRGVLLAKPLDGRLHHRLPRVVFLAADEVPGAEPAVVRGAAILEVVQVVAHEMGVNARLPHRLREGVVEGLERSPAPVHEVEPSGVQIAPCGHAREAAHEVAVEGYGGARETVEVGCLHPGRAVTAQRVATQRIEQDEYRLHGPFSSLGTGR